VHVEDVIRADRGCVSEANDLGRDRLVGDEAERCAATRQAIDLQEQEIVAVGEEPDPVAGDVLLADGAPHPVEQRAEAILRTHPAGV